MFRRAILAALAFAAEGGDDHLARRALSRVDPLVALWCRPRVAKAIITASSLVADRSDRSHVLRLAYLHAAGALSDIDYEDRAAVSRAFEAHAAGGGPLRRYRYVSVLALAAAVATLGGIAVHHWRAKPWDPREIELGHALADDLPSYVASVANASRSSDRAPDAGRAPARPIDEDSRDRVVHAVAADLGAVGGDAARALLLDYQAAALSTTDDRALDDLMYGALQRTNGALHDAHRLYWLDIIGDGRSGPLVVSYYVSRSSAVHVDGVTIPLLHLQRLDSLNRSLAALGYTSPRVGAAVVTLDTLEDEAVSLLLPALGDDAVAHTVDAETEKHAPDWVLPLERRVGAVLRAEVPVARRAALAEIAGLLAGRADLLATLRRAAAWSDESISAPKRLVDSARFEELEGRVARGLLDDWRSTNDTLAEPRLREATDAYLSALASIVGRHEIQHQIDFRSGIIPVPADLRETLGARGGTDLAPTSLEARCRDELSAELAAIASTRELASTALSMAVIPVFDQRDWGSPYAYVAASLLTALGRELGGSGEIYADGGAFRRDDAAAAYLAIASKSGPEIAAGAGRAYARLFGHELPTVEVGAWQISPRWSR